METPSPPEAVKLMYLIDRIKDGECYYLWAVFDGEWTVVKCGGLEDIIKQLQKMEGENAIQKG